MEDFTPITETPNTNELDDSTIEVSTLRPEPVEVEMDHVVGAESAHGHSHPSPSDDMSLGLDGTSEPRRGSFTATIPPGHMIPNPINDDLLTRTASVESSSNATPPLVTDRSGKDSDGVPNHNGWKPNFTSHTTDQQTDSDPEFKNSRPLIFNPTAQRLPSTVPTSQPQQHGVFGMLQLDPPRPSQMGPPREPKTSSRRVKNYTLSDGTVVSGKGLGRGRPGIKRGPRSLKYPNDDPDSPLMGMNNAPSPMSLSSPFTSATAATSSGKRKWSDTFQTNPVRRMSASASATSDSRDSSPEYNPIEETRSGRKTQKPIATATPLMQSTSPATKRSRVDTQSSNASASPSVPKSHPKIKRRIYRGREQLALCEHCLRGHGPTGNVIVFCDACNKCWHQRCHSPQVPQSIISDTKAEWFCSDCDRILHGKKGKQKPGNKPTSKTNTSTPVPPSTNQPSFSGPLIGGSALTLPQRTSYLHSLPKDRLISLILSAAELAPALPLFQAPTPPPLPQAQFKSNYTTPIFATPLTHQNAATAATAAGSEDVDEGYDSYFDEHALLYPKPGEGVKLPPESVDLHMLLEGKGSRTFSHWVRGRPGQEFSGTGDVRVVV